jgi:hypothetical protein
MSSNIESIDFVLVFAAGIIIGIVADAPSPRHHRRIRRLAQFRIHMNF